MHSGRACHRNSTSLQRCYETSFVPSASTSEVIPGLANVPQRQHPTQASEDGATKRSEGVSSPFCSSPNLGSQNLASVDHARWISAHSLHADFLRLRLSHANKGTLKSLKDIPKTHGIARKEVFESVQSAVNNTKNLLVFGKKRVGKTTLVHQVLRDAIEGGRPAFRAKCNQNSSVEMILQEAFLWNKPNGVPPRGAITNIFAEELAPSKTPDRLPLIVIDNVDVLPEAQMRDLLDLGQDYNDAGVATFVFVCDGDAREIIQDPSAGTLKHLYIGDLTDLEAMELVRMAGYEEDAAREIVALVGGDLEYLIGLPDPKLFDIRERQDKMFTEIKHLLRESEQGYKTTVDLLSRFLSPAFDSDCLDPNDLATIRALSPRLVFSHLEDGYVLSRITRSYLIEKSKMPENSGCTADE